MPDDNLPSPSPTPTPSEPKSLRSIAEEAYDSLESTSDAAESPENDSDEGLATEGQPRDKSGRWVAKDSGQPGEAIAAERRDPAPKPQVTGTQSQEQPDPAAPQARSNQAPEHWSAEDKASFARLPEEGRAFVLRRHGEMEAEFTRKSQASAGAVHFAQSLAPVFTDDRIMSSLQQMGLNPAQAIHEWAGFHLKATSPRQEDKFNLLVDLTQRMGLDPARIFAALNQPPPLPPGMTDADMKDPALRYFADHLGRTTSDLQTLRNELQQIRQAEVSQREETALRSARWSIDQYADEKGQNGQPLRPYFDHVLPMIIDMFKANPNRDMNEAYDAACWAHPEIRKHMLAAQQRSAQTQTDVQRARNAQRANTRGLTAPVSRPNGADGPSKGGLRDAIERSAEEIGY